jgi:hypothetical protein
MTLEEVSYVAQTVGSVAVVLSLLFVGFQIKQNTAAIRREEHNSTMEQWTVIRMAIVTDRSVAQLLTDGLYGSKPLDDADQMRLDQLLNEYVWASFHIWDRMKRGVFPPGTFEAACGRLLSDLLRTKAGQVWWRAAPTVGLAPPFIADVDAILAAPVRAD